LNLRPSGYEVVFTTHPKLSAVLYKHSNHYFDWQF